MANNTDRDIDISLAQRDAINAESIDPAPPTFEETERRNAFLEVPSQIVGGIIDAGNDFINTAVDVFGMPTGRLAEEFAEFRTRDFMLTDQQRQEISTAAGRHIQGQFRSFAENFLELPDAPEPSRALGRFTRDMTSFAAKMTALMAGGAGVKAATFGAGALSDPLEADSLIELAVDNAPDVVKDKLKPLREALDSNSIKDQLIQRSVNGVEEVALLVAGDKAIRKAAEAIPDGTGKKFIDSFKNLSGKSVKAFLLSRKGVDIDDNIVKGFTKDRFEEGFTISVNQNALDKVTEQDLTGALNQQQLRSLVSVDINANARIPDTEAFNKAVIGVKNQISDVFKERLKDKPVTQKAVIKSLDESAETMARNIVVDATVLRQSQSYKALTEARTAGDAVAETALFKQVKDNTKDVITAILEKQKQDTTAGRTLRSAQEITQPSRKAIEQAKELGAAISPNDTENGMQKILSLFDEVNGDQVAEEAAVALQFMENIGGSTDEIAAAFSKEAAKVGQNKSVPAKVFEAVQSTFINGILSSPATQALNLTSNEAMLFLKGVDSFFAGTLSGQKLSTSTLFLRDVMQRHAEAAFLAGSAAKATTAGRGFKAALKSQNQFLKDKGLVKGNGFAALSTRQRDDLLRQDKVSELRGNPFSAQAFDVPDDALLGKSINILGMTAGGGFVREGMQATDNVFKSVAVRAEMRQFLQAKVIDEDAFGLDELGLDGAKKKLADILAEGGELDDFTSQVIAAGVPQQQAGSVSRQMLKLQAEAQERATKTALEATFQTPLGEFGSKAQGLLQNAGGGAGRFFFPFVTTPTNIFKEIVARAPVVPLGDQAAAGLPISPQFYKDFIKGGEARNRAMARALTGNALFVTGMEMWEQGSIFIADENPAKAKLEGELGLQRMSVNVGDANIGGFAKLAPFSPIMAAGAATKRALDRYNYNGQLSDAKESELTRLIGTNMTTIADAMLQLPLLAQVQTGTDVLRQAVRDPNAAGESVGEFVGTTASGLVPLSSLLRFAGRQGDPLLRNTKAIEDKITDLFGGEVLPYFNALGEPVERGTPTLFGSLIGKKDIKNDPIVLRMLEAEYTPEPMKMQIAIQGEIVELNKEEFEVMNDLFANKIDIRGRLFDTMLSVEFDALPKSQRNSIINSVFRQAKRELAQDMLELFPRIGGEAQVLSGFKQLQDINFETSVQQEKVNDILFRTRGK